MVGLVNAESSAYVIFSVILSFKSSKDQVDITSQFTEIQFFDQNKRIFVANFAKMDKLLKSIVVHM